MSTENPVRENSSDLDYAERFEQDRSKWTNLLKSMASRFKEINDMNDVQIDIYSHRQEAVEHIHKLIVVFNKIKKKYNTAFAASYEQLARNDDYRYSEKEKIRFAEEKNGEIKFKMEMLQTQIDFFRETLKSIDNMIFGIKSRIDIEEYRRGHK